MKDLEVFSHAGKNKVRIAKNKYGTELSICTNGFQWTGMSVNMEIFELLDDAVKEFKRVLEDKE
jgi:hypothetical protein